MGNQSLTVNGIKRWNEICPRIVAANIGHACTGLHQGGTWYSLEQCNEIKKICLTCPLRGCCVYDLRGESKLRAIDILMKDAYGMKYQLVR